jgi:hypothetical protein
MDNLKRDKKRIDKIFNRPNLGEKCSDLSELETLHSDWMSSDEELEFLIYSANNSITLSLEEDS